MSETSTLTLNNPENPSEPGKNIPIDKKSFNRYKK